MHSSLGVTQFRVCSSDRDSSPAKAVLQAAFANGRVCCWILIKAHSPPLLESVGSRQAE